MTYKHFFILVFVIAAVSCPLFSSGNSDVSVEPESPNMEYEELAELVNDTDVEYILIDVRTADEYNSGYVPTAINIPYDIITENLPTEDKETLIIVYCRSGRRSG